MRLAWLSIPFFAGAHALTQPVAKRGSSDICANVNADLNVPNLISGNSYDVGYLSVCLCVSGIPSFMKTNPIATFATVIAGVSMTDAALSNLITTASDSKHCSYPDYCSPFCASDRPCGFTCHEGFTPSPEQDPTDCICESPKQICNGKCTSSPCSSQVPSKRDNKVKRAVCDAGLTPCGIYSGYLQRSYECIDTTSDLESCGGCSVPLHENSSIGVDCTSLSGVADVSCRAGSCFVQSCMPGYQLSIDSSMCIDVDAFEKVLLPVAFVMGNEPLHVHTAV